ncbi:GumC family protein [Azospirillum sp. B4]|uniref:GumC family protein n=1 Tax=Azospirillum sp. B4 TaxID=95605 RepID=UPI0005CB57F9|nr:GumC family protein [Azospirillum sp. B4]
MPPTTQTSVPPGAAPGAFTSPALPIAFTVRDLVLILFRYRQRALAAFGFCLGAAILVSVLMRPVHESDASVLINKFSREFTYRADAGAAAAAALVPMTNDPEELLNTQVQLIRSRDVIIATVKKVGLDRLYPALAKSDPDKVNWDKVVDRFSDALGTVPQRTSNILHLSFRHREATVAAATLDTLIQVFRDKSITVYLNSQTQFYETQVAEGHTRVDAAYKKLADFRRAHGVQAFDGQMALLLQQRLDLDSEAKRVDADLAGARQRAVELKRQIKETPPDVTAYTDREQSRVVDEARTKLLNLHLREKELSAQFTDESRQMQQLRQEIAVAEQFLKTEEGKFAGTVRRARNDVLTGAEQDLNRTLADTATLEGRKRDIETQIAGVDGRINTMTGSEAQRWTLERDLATAQESLKALMSRLEEARASDSLNRGRVGNIAIVQAPSMSREPVQPKPLLNLALGILAGLFLAVVAALLSEFASDTIYDPARAERLLGVPALAVFNLQEKPAET